MSGRVRRSCRLWHLRSDRIGRSLQCGEVFCVHAGACECQRERDGADQEPDRGRGERCAQVCGQRVHFAVAEGGESWREWDQGAHQAECWSGADEDAGVVQAPLDRKLVVCERVLDAGLFTSKNRSRDLEKGVARERAGRSGQEHACPLGVGDDLASEVP
jgi:hypothetical protein